MSATSINHRPNFVVEMLTFRIISTSVRNKLKFMCRGSLAMVYSKNGIIPSIHVSDKKGVYWYYYLVSEELLQLAHLELNTWTERTEPTKCKKYGPSGHIKYIKTLWRNITERNCIYIRRSCSYILHQPSFFVVVIYFHETVDKLLIFLWKIVSRIVTNKFIINKTS